MKVNRGKQFEEQIKQAFLNVKDCSVDRLYDTTSGFIGVANICDFIIYKLIKELETKINKQLFTSFMATSLFLTIRSDTSNFQNNNTNALAFQISGDLLKLGVDIVVCFDHDKAGRKCTEQAILKLKNKTNVFEVTLPEGKDPADCTKEELLTAYLSKKKV